MSSLPESLLHFRTDLEDAIRHELEAEATARSNGWGARVLRAVQRRPGRTTLALAAVAGAAAAALFVSSPWKTPPGLLEEVQAALTPEGSILHMKWELTTTSSDLACTVTHGPNEIWIDQTPPRRYRVLLNEHFGSADLRALACSGGTVAELGGTFDPGPKARKPPGFDPSGPARRPTLRFVPPNTLSSSFGNWPFYFGDPVADLREWLSSGRAYDEGTMQLDGRTVERIRIDPPSFCPVSSCPRKPNYAYVDPETFYPLQIECEDCGGISLRGRVLRLHMVTRFLTYEPLLPRTAANLALTDIRAQHPDATWTTEPVLFLPRLSGAVAKTVRVAKGAKGARVTFDVTATAGDGGDLPAWCQPRSGSRFPLGKTFVQCEATDARGSTATAEFTVTVKRRR